MQKIRWIFRILKTRSGVTFRSKILAAYWVLTGKMKLSNKTNEAD